jgi:PTS system mannose-specific IIA component
MIGIVLAAHQPLGSALAAAARHVLGAVPLLAVVDVVPDTPLESIQQQIQSAIVGVDNGEGVLVLTDLFGATPSNVASQLMGVRMKLVAGVNLPMLLRALSYRNESLDVVVEKAVSGAMQGIVKVGSKVPQKQAAPSDLSHQKDSHFHQYQQQ